jgi:hypothetical protein
MIFMRNSFDTLLRFVKINDINEYKIHNRTNYLLISYSQNKNKNEDYSIYNYIKDNNKPIIIINKQNENKYTYLINNINNFKCKYELNYNQKRYKYLFEITSKEIEQKKTYWNVVAKVNEVSNFNFIVFQLMNWINHIINTNINNYHLKRYIIMCYLLNLSL